jgi:hypothetical protein
VEVLNRRTPEEKRKGKQIMEVLTSNRNRNPEGRITHV